MRVFFSNLGCKLNQAEVDRLSRQFVAAGHSLAPELGQADLHVINSCTVTHLAARDSRKLARRGRRSGGAVRTVLTGCYATAEPREAARLAGVDLVVDNRKKDRLLELVHTMFPEARPAATFPESRPAATSPIPYVPIAELLNFGGRARALVKIEDGCNMGCSFCIIPSTRGRQRSRPLDEVVEEVRALAAGGYPEVVVTGVQISEYDDGGRRLFDLVAALLERTDVPRLRLTSIAPWKFDPRLLELWTDPRLCRHVHMSLQSGSTATLRRMRRPYTADAYAELAERLRAQVPGLALTTDVIVGFPGETQAEFADSLAFVERLAFARPHVFTFSPRAGTHAATLPDQVPPEEKKARMAEMRALAVVTDRAFRRRHLGQSLGVVWEERKASSRREAGGTTSRRGPDGGRWSGLTDNYIRVFADSDRDLAGTLGRARLDALAAGGVQGALITA